jgi:hypothetical protein
MKVAFDAVCLGDGPPTGVARAFLTGLAAYLPHAPGDVLLVLPEDTLLPAGIDVAVARTPRGGLSRRLALRRLLRDHRCDLLHSSVAAVPYPSPCPTIATVHDLPWLEAPKVEPTMLRTRVSTWFTLRTARAVIVPSQYTAARVARVNAPTAARTRVIPHGVQPPESPANPTELRGPFLVIGDDRPRKNKKRTAAGHAWAKLRCRDLPPLRFVGPPGDYVDEAEKLRLLRTSRGLLHLSLLEGFGLPVVEAMAHGVPVLAANSSSLPEVCGGAALLVDPRDVEAIGAGIARLHLDSALRADLHVRGLARAAAFPPDAVGRAWRTLHQEIAG